MSPTASIAQACSSGTGAIRYTFAVGERCHVQRPFGPDLQVGDGTEIPSEHERGGFRAGIRDQIGEASCQDKARPIRIQAQQIQPPGVVVSHHDGIVVARAPRGPGEKLDRRGAIGVKKESSGSL